VAIKAIHGTPQVHRASGVAWTPKPTPVLEAAVDIAFDSADSARAVLAFVKASPQFPMQVSAGSCAAPESPVRHVFDLRTCACHEFVWKFKICSC